MFQHILSLSVAALILTGCAVLTPSRDEDGFTAAVFHHEWSLKYCAADGTTLKQENVRFDREKLVLSPPDKSAGQYALLNGVLTADADGFAILGAGADYFMELNLNGTTVFSTRKTGNGGNVFDANAHVFAVPVRKGDNSVAVWLRPGSGGWSFSIRTLKPDREARSQLNRRLLPPGLNPKRRSAFGPWVMFPGPTVHLLSDGPGDAVLELRETGTSTIQRYVSSTGPHHRWELSAAPSNRKFNYRTIDDAGASEWKQLQTPPDSGAEFEFFFLSDTHKHKVYQAFDEGLDFRRSAFVVHGGDLADSILDGFYDVGQTTVRFFAQTGVPLLYVPGNHDVAGPDAQNGLDMLRPVKNDLFGAFQYGDACFVVLSAGYANPAADRKIQTAFLKDLLKRPEYHTAKYRIVLSHIPPGHSQTKDVGFKLMDELAGILNAGSPIQLWLAGHTHQDYRHLPGRRDKGATQAWRDTFPDLPFPLLTAGAGGTIEEFSCIRVQVTERNLRVTVCGASGEVRDEFTATPDGRGQTQH